MSSQYETIKSENLGQTALITFNRPDCYNAMNKLMKNEIVQAIKTANKDTKIRSIILTGEGKAFSSGQDLNDRTVKAEHGPVDLGKTLETEWNPLVNAIYNSPKPVIAAINGVVAGAGVSVALTCDMLICVPKAKFVSGFAQIGLAPDAGSGHIMVKHLGYQKAYEFFLMGTQLLAEELMDKGLVNQISEAPLDEAKKLAEKINALPPLSVSMIKRNLHYAQDVSRQDCIERETYTQRFLGNSQDYQEGVKAFFEKRPAKFEGK